MTHAFLAQFFFCLTVGVATFSSPTWMMAVDRKVNVGSLRRMCAVTVAALFVQLLLGAAFRHRGLGILPHIVGAVVVSVLIVWVVVAMLRQTKGAGGTAVMIRLRRPALLALVLLLAQVTLGVFAYFARIASQSDPQPLPPMVWLTVAHVACGALLLAVVLRLTLRVFHLSIPPDALAEFEPTAQRATS
jgi:heme A synthase